MGISFLTEAATLWWITSAMKRHIDSAFNSKLFKKPQHLKNVHLKLISTKRRGNTKNQSLSGFFHPSVRSYPTVEFLLQLFHHILRRKGSRGFGNWHRFAVSCSSWKKLKDCIWPEMKVEWEKLRSEDGNEELTVDLVGSFFPRTFPVKHTKKHDNWELGTFNESLDWKRCYVFPRTRTAVIKLPVESSISKMKVKANVF